MLCKCYHSALVPSCPGSVGCREQGRKTVMQNAHNAVIYSRRLVKVRLLKGELRKVTLKSTCFIAVLLSQATSFDMADDGLLMNFAIDDVPLNTKPVFKGGRWRDRLQAKKSLQRRGQNFPNVDKLTGVNAIPTKDRRPTNGDNDPPLAKRQKTNPNAVSKPQPAARPTEVVSSLFTSNPSSKPQTKEQETTNDQPPIPSNAPLPEGFSNFTTLGLSATLTTHLLTSLSLKTPTAIQKAALTHLLAEDSDAFIQAETGSGKTLAYLLPIIQRMMALKLTNTERIDRKSGLFALILAPTRELAKQIDVTLSALLKKMPWIVHGTVTGGATKNHEKARIRKGINVLVATPGRLADHLENTEALDVGAVRWVVLDEGDRLVELGFEEEIRKIVEFLDRKGKKRKRRVDEERGDKEEKEPSRREIVGLPENRSTVLCSATMKVGVQKLGDISLKDAVLIKVDPVGSDADPTTNDERTGEDEHAEDSASKEKPFLAPAQLKQSYIISPAKQRLVTLTALLKRTFERKGSVMKAIVFLSCADSVDFHFELFAREQKVEAEEQGAPLKSKSAEKSGKSDKLAMRGSKEEDNPNPQSPEAPPQRSKAKQELPTLAHTPTLSSPHNLSLQIYKLHGSLPQALRTSTLASFSRTTEPSILFCTDVASRGLDLPNIDLVIEYDPPFSSDDHLHRVGRTARAGREGRAICFLMPGPEEGYTVVLKAGAGKGTVKGENADDVLRKGFTASGLQPRKKEVAVPVDGALRRWDERATEWQLDVERWVVDDQRAGEMAKKAYVSHVRAYATHVAKERDMFDVKELHLGHLAKAFALREKPGSMGRGGSEKVGKGDKRRLNSGQSGSKKVDWKGDNEAYENVRPDWRGDLDLPATDAKEAARKMRTKMNEHMAVAGEFNIG